MLTPNSELKHWGPIAGIAACGDWIATAGYDNQLILWDASERRALARACHDHLVNQCAFSSDGHWLVSASSDYSARVWSLPELRLHTVLVGHADDVDMAAFSPDDQRIATCALDRCVRIFDLAGECLHEMRGHTGNVLSLAWSPDGQRLVTSSVDGTLREWDADTGEALATTHLEVRSDSVEIGADGTVYAADDFGRIAILHGGALHFVQAHRAGVKKIAIDAAQTRLVSLSYDRTLVVWEISAGDGLRELSRTTLPKTVWARAATLLPDGRVATGTFGSTYAVYDPQEQSWDCRGVAAGTAINAVLEVDERTYAVGDSGRVCVDGRHVADMGSLCNFLVACGRRVYTGGQLGELYDAEDGAVVYRHRSPLNCGVSFLRDGNAHLAVGTYTGEIVVFAVGTKGALQRVCELAVYDNAIKGLSCSDGLLFSVCASTDIAWHHIADWSLARRVEHAHERIANACCSLGDGRFATVGRDRTLRLWGPDEAAVFESPHPNSVKCIGVNDQHTAILTGSYGGTLALFDLGERRWTCVRRPTSAGISSITWDRERSRFLAASYDGAIYTVPA